MAKSKSKNLWKERVDRDFCKMSDHILRYFPAVNDYSPIEKAAALHLYVYEKVDYELRDDRDFKPPKDCWRSSGNCQEQTIILASLLKSMRKLEIRIRSLSHDQDREYGHQTLEIKFPYSPQDVTDSLENFYNRTRHFDQSTSEFSWSCSKKDDYVWMVADPTMSTHIGALSEHEEKGYVGSSSGSWDWYQVDSTWYL